MNNHMFTYYQRGFSLLNKNLYIFGISFLLSLFTIYKYFFILPTPNTMQLQLLGIVNILASLAVIIFSFMLPILFIQALHNKKQTVSDLFTLSVRTIRRIVIPIAILATVVLSVVFLFVAFFNSSPTSPVKNIASYYFFGSNFFFYYLFFALHQLEKFHASLVMLSNKPFFKSYFISPVLFIKEYKFTMYLVLFTLLISLSSWILNTTLSTVFFANVADQITAGFILRGLLRFGISTIAAYVGLGLTASVVIYYQEKIAPRLK